MSFSAFCESLGCPLTNVTWSWSAMSANGRRAVFTIWSDLVEGRIPTATYVLWTPGQGINSRLGARELHEHASRCAADAEIEALGILCDPENPLADPRVRKDYRKEYVLKLRVTAQADGSLLATVTDKVPRSRLAQPGTAPSRTTV